MWMAMLMQLWRPKFELDGTILEFGVTDYERETV